MRSKKSGKHLKDLLVDLSQELAKKLEVPQDEILKAWNEIVGKQVAEMTVPVSFEQETLHVKVKNSTLYGLLVQHERQRLLNLLRERFPKVKIKAIRFKLGS